MDIPDKDLRVECTRGKGPGGQHKNKTNSCVEITHIPTGIKVRVDGRHQSKNKKAAMKELEIRLKNLTADNKAKIKKDRRDHAIANPETIRTYDFKKGIVRNHKNGKSASLKDVLIKGNIDLLRGEEEN